MKNVFLIPTFKPSRVYNIIGSKRLGFTSKDPFYTENIGGGTLNQHIYITSDEEIKLGDWVIEFQKGDDIGEVHFINGKYVIANDIQKKIILTTDQDLVSDGVQAIDDEFLEWFVQNPSCEKIKTYSLGVKNELTGESGHYKYEIIIPQEEPKQECTCGVCDYCEEQESIQILKEAKESFLKQETFQERVDYISFLHTQNLNGRETEDELFKAGIIAGIEETEEVMLDLMDAYADDVMGGCTLKAKEWFEKHKKK
jgi:hypothetical protein